MILEDSMQWITKKSYLCFRRLVHAAQRVEAARVADVRQALRDDFYEKFPPVADAHVRRGMAYKLRLAAALCGEETEGDELPLTEVQPAAGIIVAETVVDEPFVDLPVRLPPRSFFAERSVCPAFFLSIALF